MLPERRKIVDLWKRGGAMVLATLVHVEGSSYRRPGARLLLCRDGAYAGAISGGCLEAEVLRKAQWLVREGATVQRYSTLFDDTADMPYGLGCGGTVDVLLEPADTCECMALMEALKCSLAGDPRHVMTQLPGSGMPLTRFIRNAQGTKLFCSTAAFRSDAVAAFDELLEPPRRLLVFGAGDDAQPVVRMATLLGWTAIVIDGRAQWARPERFPEAEQVVVATDLRALNVTSNDAAVVMTHSYDQDRGWLTALLPHSPWYLGLLGARHRSALLLRDAAEALSWSLERACQNIFAPIGLDLGGEGAEAIALAIIAEVQACMENRLPAARRMSAAAIVEQIALGGASRYQQTQCAL